MNHQQKEECIQPKNGRYPYHSFENSKQEAKNKKFSKEKNVSPKEKHVSPREKGMNDP